MDDHVAELKSGNPGVKVHTRRDRDGFAIVRTSFEPDFKYNLDELEALNLDQTRDNMLSAMEALMSTSVEGAPQVETKRDLIKVCLSNLRDEGQQYEFDAFTTLRINELATNVIKGKVEASSLFDALVEISDGAETDTSRPTASPFNVMPDVLDSGVRDMIADRELFQAEISYQLSRRIKRHLYLTKRSESDYIKPRMSEATVYEQQKRSHDNELNSLMDEQEAMEREEGFDRAAFDKMKAEISARKEAKERLLSQGLPEFKGYLRL